jgi:hypothetical protein
MRTHIAEPDEADIHVASPSSGFWSSRRIHSGRAEMQKQRPRIDRQGLEHSQNEPLDRHLGA